MKYLVIVQARCSSRRFPHKVLADLSGKSVLQRVIDRVKKSRCIDELLVATTIQKEDLAIVSFCAQQGVRVFAGSEDDVLDRFYQVIKLLNPEYVIRLTADCPLFDATLLDQAIQSMDEKSDYLGMMSETFPDGLDLEIIKTDTLKLAWQQAKLTSEREHVTLYIRNHPELFVLQDFIAPVSSIGHYRLTLDETFDYEVISKIWAHFLSLGIDDFSYLDVIEYLNQNPEIEKINQHIQRNEGLGLSLKTDGILDSRNEV